MRSMILAAVMALSTTAAFADNTKMMEEMSAGLTMLEASAKLVLKEYGFEADVMSLSLGQLAEIQGVLTSSNNDSDKKAGIEAALRK
jgi:hypothetical protein